MEEGLLRSMKRRRERLQEINSSINFSIFFIFFLVGAREKSAEEVEKKK